VPTALIFGASPRLTPGREGGRTKGILPPVSLLPLSFHLLFVLNDNKPLIVTVHSSELITLAEKMERYVLVKRAVDAESGEDGAGMVYLTGREIELIAECVRRVGADRWREGG